MLRYIRFVICAIIVMVGIFLNLIICLFRPFHPNNTQFFARIFIPIMYKVLGIKFEIINKENLKDTPAVFIANHQSNWDIFFFGGLCIDRGLSVGKKSIRRIPFFGWTYWLGGHVLIDRSKKETRKSSMVEAFNAITKKACSIIIFPEGKRGKGNGLGSFKPGGFRLAIDTQIPVVPLSLSEYSKVGFDFNKWHNRTLKLYAHDPIPTTGLTLDDLEALSNLSREKIIEGLRMTAIVGTETENEDFPHGTELNPT